MTNRQLNGLKTRIMNTLTTSAVTTSSTSLGFIGNLAKSQLLKRLQALPRGYLEIEDDGDDLHSLR